LKDIDYIIFHSPYSKLVQKSYARLLYLDYLMDPTDSTRFGTVPEHFASLQPQETITNKEVEKTFMGLAKDSFEKVVGPGLTVSRNCGNMYCASLYSGLASLLDGVDGSSLVSEFSVFCSYFEFNFFFYMSWRTNPMHAGWKTRPHVLLRLWPLLKHVLLHPQNPARHAAPPRLPPPQRPHEDCARVVRRYHAAPREHPQRQGL
jgi:hypothetical protein